MVAHFRRGSRHRNVRWQTSSLPQVHLEVNGQEQSGVSVQQATDKIFLRAAFCDLQGELRLKGLLGGLLERWGLACLGLG